MCVESGESVKNEASGYSKIKTKSSLVSRGKLCSLGLIVLNSITVPFYLFIFLNLRQSTTRDRQEKKIKKKNKTKG